jgi:hypothetical protein
MTINTKFNKGDRVYINLVPMTIWFTEITDIMVDGGIVKYRVKTNYDPAYIIEDRCFSTSEELIKNLDVVSVLKGKS